MPKATHSLGVLFVNIGWSEDYDGSELPRGNHAWLKGKRAEEEGSADAELFVNDRGRHLGPIGLGRVPSFQRLDVVFTARDSTGRRRIVALFRECRPEPHDSSPEFMMITAKHKRVTCLSVPERPLLPFWPGRMGFRRWALGGPGREWQELRRVYESLVRRHGA